MATGNLADSLSQMREIQGDQSGQISSLSGHERNPFFYNREGRRFDDLSLISGADSDRDGRAVALWDYDRDGFLDLAVVNANAPKLALYHNQLAGQPADRHCLFLRFQGANTAGASDAKKSNRDGYGCVVFAVVGGKTLRSEHHCGAGFAAQNSALMHLGIGSSDQVDSLTVRWPSGTIQSLEKIPAGSLVTLPEQAAPTIAPYATP